MLFFILYSHLFWMFWEWLSFQILSSDLWGSSSQLKASNMDLMVIACRSALDKTSKPQYIIHMCIVNHFPNVYYICSVKESHVCLISVLFVFWPNSFNTLRDTQCSVTLKIIVAWNKMFKRGTQMLWIMLFWCLAHYAGILFNHCLVLLSYYYSFHTHTCVCAHTNTRLHISVSKRASAFTLFSNCLAPHTPAKIP